MSMESDVRTMKGIMVAWLVVIVLLVLWVVGSFAWAKYKASQADDKESGSSTTPAIKVGGLSVV